MLLLHGFMSYKEGDGYLFRKTAEKFAEVGIASARIDFCSMGENRYSRVHYGTEICVKEAKTAFEYLQYTGLAPAVHTGRLFPALPCTGRIRRRNWG